MISTRQRQFYSELAIVDMESHVAVVPMEGGCEGYCKAIRVQATLT